MNHHFGITFLRMGVAAGACVALCVTTSAVHAQERFVEQPDGMRIPLQERAYPMPAEIIEQIPASQILRPLPMALLKVDLTPFQSPVKSQGGRDTCGTFATAAALEAAYQRNHGAALDLSELFGFFLGHL